jgi:hypothetical protein
MMRMKRKGNYAACVSHILPLSSSEFDLVVHKGMHNSKLSVFSQAALNMDLIDGTIN